MKANFKKLTVEVFFGEYRELDVANVLGNFIHANTADIGLDDVAREIYYSEGEIEIDESHAKLILEMIKKDYCDFVASIKKAIVKELTK